MREMSQTISEEIDEAIETWTIAYAPELEIDDWDPSENMIRFRISPWESIIVDGIESPRVNAEGKLSTISQPMATFKNNMSNDMEIPLPFTEEIDEWHWVFCGTRVQKGTSHCGRYECLATDRKKGLGLG